MRIERPLGDSTTDRGRLKSSFTAGNNMRLDRIILPHLKENLVIDEQTDKCFELESESESDLELNYKQQKQQQDESHLLSQPPLRITISKPKALSSSFKLDHATAGLVNWTLLIILMLLTPAHLVYSKDSIDSQQIMVQQQQANDKTSLYRLTLGEYPTSNDHSIFDNQTTSWPDNAPKSSPAPNQLQFNQTLINDDITKNPIHQLKFGRDFGERIHLNTSSSSSSLDSLLARTIRQLNGLNNNPTANSSEKSNNTLFDQQQQQQQQKLQEGRQVANVDRRDYETIKLVNISQPQRRNFSIISSLFKYRGPNFSTSPATSLLKSNYPLLLDSLAKFTNRHLMNVSQSIGVSSGQDNATIWDKKLSSDLQQFIINPSSEMLKNQKSSNSTGWIPASSQETSDAATNLNNLTQAKPDISNNSAISLIVEPEFDLQANDTKDYHQVVALNTNSKTNSNHHINNNKPNDLASFVQRQQLLASQASQLAPKKQDKKLISKVIPVDWSASDIEQVIHSKKHDAIESGGNDVEGEKMKKETGKGDSRVMGEKLRDHEDLSHWKNEKHGHEEAVGEGKKGAKEGANFIKDLGHDRHGWKNVYHKEEYAQHQKFHDIFRDKDWNDKKAKLDESYNYKNGQKFNDTQSKDYYDKDKHGTKYDYRKGNEWRRYEDDQYDKSNDEMVERNKDKKVNDWEFEGQQQQQQHQPEKHDHESEPEGVPSQNYARDNGQNYASDSPNDQQQVGDSDFGSDDAVIEQMKDKLDMLSEAKNPYLNGEQIGPSNQIIRASASKDSKATVSDNNDMDYESEMPWNAQQSLEIPKTDISSPLSSSSFSPLSASSHQSVNEIVRTAKRANTKRGTSKQSSSNYRPVNNSSISSESYRLNNQDSDDDNDNDSDLEPQEKPMAKQENRKNELRLKLELDLGKSSVGQRSKLRRNQTIAPAPATTTASSGPKESNNSNQTNESNRNNMSRDRKGSANKGWQPRDTHQQAPRSPMIGNGQSNNHDHYQTNRHDKNLRNNRQYVREPQTKVGSPPIKQGSDETPVGWNTNNRHYNNNFHKQPSNNNRNISLSSPQALNNLAQVLPSRPIFVKHLQMNGGVVLGKVNGLEANKTIEQQPPLMPLMSEDMTVETSLSNPYGDMLTLSGLNQMPSMQNLQHQEPSADGKEFMVVFGDHQSAGDNSQQEQQAVISEPNVIFEAASAMDEDRQPLIGDSFSIASHQQQFRKQQQQQLQQTDTDMEHLMSQEQPVRLEDMVNFEPQQQAFKLQQQPVLQVTDNKPGDSASKHPFAVLQENRLSNLLKFTALNYTDPLSSHGPSVGGSIVAPTNMQQAFNRLLRFPKVLGITRPKKYKTMPYYPPSRLPLIRWQQFKKGNFRGALKGVSGSSTKLIKQQLQQFQQLQQLQQQSPSHVHTSPITPMESYNDLLAEAASKVVTTSIRNPFMLQPSNNNSNEHIKPTNKPPQRLPAVFNSNKLGDNNKNNTQAQQVKTVNNKQAKKLNSNEKKRNVIKSKRKKKSSKNSQPNYLQQYNDHQFAVDVARSNVKFNSKPLRFESNYTALNPRPDKFIPIQQYWQPKITKHFKLPESMKQDIFIDKSRRHQTVVTNSDENNNLVNQLNRLQAYQDHDLNEAASNQLVDVGSGVFEVYHQTPVKSRNKESANFVSNKMYVTRLQAPSPIQAPLSR